MRYAIALALVLAIARFTPAAGGPVPSKVVTYKHAETYKAAGRKGKAGDDKTVGCEKLGEVPLRLHIFHPPGHKPRDRRSAIVFFFSGGWNVGSPTQFFPQCEYFASRGMVAISAEYRVKSRHGSSPRECVKDAKSAIRWIRRHADELGIDPNQLAAGGGSAGGHIAAAAATLRGFNEAGEDQGVSCIPNALVLFNPAIDNGPKVIGPRIVDDAPANLPQRKQAGWGYGQVREYWREFSPMHNISQTTPPTVIFLGGNDAYISTATVAEFKQRMEAKGRRCDLRIYKNQPHEFYNFKNKNKYYLETLLEAHKFLASLGFLPALQGNLE